MAMNAENLASEIMAEMQKKGFTQTDGNQKYTQALATAIVKHITQNAVVTGGVCTPSGPIADGKVS